MKKLVIVSVVLLCLTGGLVSLAVDFNGDGRDDIAIFRENTGLWAVRGVTRLYFGSKLDIPIPGNYFGGSAAEVSIFRPSTGLWAVRGYTRLYFGTDGDMPLGQSGLKQSRDFFYDPAKHAFRAGRAVQNRWNDQSVGPNSVATGFATTADGYASTATGYYSTASGSYSTAMGYGAIASGYSSTALGYYPNASNDYATAMGLFIEVSGSHSFGYGSDDSFGVNVSADKVFVIHGVDVGIGATNPQVELQVYDREGGSDNDVKLRLASRSSNNDAVIEFYEGSSAAMSLHYDGGSSPNKLVIKDLTTPADRVTFERSGNVGIGMDDPAHRLVVADNIDSDGPAYVLNLSSNSDADGLMIKINRTTPGATNSFVSCHKANGAMIGAIVGNGSGGVEFWSSGSDFAEFLPRLQADEVIKEGDVIGVFGGKISKITHNADQLQVISTAPIVSGNAPSAGEEYGYEKVAFLGRTPVKVRGPVRGGDFIVSSGLNDGTGVAVSPQEVTLAQATQIVGIAWEASAEEEVKLIDTAVGMQASAKALEVINRKKDRQIAQIQERLNVLEDKLAKLEAR